VKLPLAAEQYSSRCGPRLNSHSPEMATARPAHLLSIWDRARPEAAERQSIEAMSTEALTTSEIERENLERASGQSSSSKKLEPETESHRIRP
jgi:hypothetical protein